MATKDKSEKFELIPSSESIDMVNTLKEVNQCLLTNTTIDNTLQNKIKSCLLDDENGNN